VNQLSTPKEGSRPLSQVGIVLLHGKGDRPKRPITALAKSLMAEGCQVLIPTMPWSGPGGVGEYSISYQGAMGIIGQEVETLQQKGASLIFMVGHSTGANGAFGFAKSNPSVTGIVAMAPGQYTQSDFHQKVTAKSLLKARKMCAQGRSQEVTSFQDYYTQDHKPIVHCTPEIYLSYFKPNGPADPQQNLSQADPNTPLLWLAAQEDISSKNGHSTQIYQAAPPHPFSQYREIAVPHAFVPVRSRRLIIDWIQRVVGSKISG
jgi:pimeloyl-ACP methyl ester carboxylesterase